MNSLGIDKDPKDTRVVVAMSGGVDSSVVAARRVRRVSILVAKWNLKPQNLDNRIETLDSRP